MSPQYVTITAALDKLDDNSGNVTLSFSDVNSVFASYTFKVNLIKEAEALNPVFINNGKAVTYDIASFEYLNSLSNEELIRYGSEKINNIIGTLKTNYTSNNGPFVLDMLKAYGYKYDINISKEEDIISFNVMVNGEICHTYIVIDMDKFFNNASVNINSPLARNYFTGFFNSNGNLKPEALRNALDNIDIVYSYGDFEIKIYSNYKIFEKYGYTLDMSYSAADKELTATVVCPNKKETTKVISNIELKDVLYIDNSYNTPIYKDLTIEEIKGLMLENIIYDYDFDLGVLMYDLKIVEKLVDGSKGTYILSATYEGLEYRLAFDFEVVNDINSYDLSFDYYEAYVDDINNITLDDIIDSLVVSKRYTKGGINYVKKIFNPRSFIEEFTFAFRVIDKTLYVDYKSESLNKSGTISTYLTDLKGNNYKIDFIGNYNNNGYNAEENKYYEILKTNDEANLSNLEILKRRFNKIIVKDRSTGKKEYYAKEGSKLTIDYFFSNVAKIEENNGITFVCVNNYKVGFRISDEIRLDSFYIKKKYDSIEAIPTMDGMISQIEYISFNFNNGGNFYMNSNSDIRDFIKKYGIWGTSGLESTITVTYKGVTTKFTAKSYLA